jgi:hypothetical protein
MNIRLVQLKSQPSHLLLLNRARNPAINVSMNRSASQSVKFSGQQKRLACLENKLPFPNYRNCHLTLPTFQKSQLPLTLPPYIFWPCYMYTEYYKLVEYPLMNMKSLIITSLSAMLLKYIIQPMFRGFFQQQRWGWGGNHR